MQSDFAVVTLPPDLAERCGSESILVEAVELCGGAMFRGAARRWKVKEGVYFVPRGAWLQIPQERWPELERLFVAARKQEHGPDYHDARNGWRNAKPASAPMKSSAPVRYQPGRRTW